jgi:hypothetical protein
MGTMKIDRSVFFVCWLTLNAGAFQYSQAQLDTVGFPLDIGNRWYYSYSSRVTPSPNVHVKTITDTATGGVHFVRETILGQDSATIGTETWIVNNGSFYDSVYGNANPQCFYNASLSQDTSWYYQYPTYQGSIHLDRASIFGTYGRCQFRSTYVTNGQGELWFDDQVALGVGWYYHHDNGWFGDYKWTYTYQLIGLLKDGILYGDSLLTSDVNTTAIIPNAFALYQNFPNPFNPSTTIKFELPKSSHVSLAVYDILGREQSVLVNERRNAGVYEVKFDGSNLASGVYFYRLEAGDFVQTKKLLILR